MGASDARPGGRAVRVAVVEDQPLYRQMLALLLSSLPDLRVVAVCPDAGSARTQLDAGVLDVVLLDLRLPDGDGMSIGRELRRRNPRLGIVVLSSADSMHALLELADSESSGWSYLSKTSSLSAPALVRAIKQTAQGRMVLDPVLTQQRRARADGPLSAVSPRQFEIIELMAEGLTNAAIAERLSLSRRSVDAHVNALYSTLGIRSTADRNPRVEVVRAYLTHTAPRAAP